MKNYLVQSLNKFPEKKYEDYQQIPWQGAGNSYSEYEQMQKLSYVTFRHFLEDDWEYVLLEGEVDDVLGAFRSNFIKLYDLGHSQPCNILFCGLDCQMLKPTKIFGRWDNFMLFNYTDPKQTIKHINNFNCDIRYYPASLDRKWWEYTLRKMNSLKVWSDEQDIYNDILWGQGLTVDDVLHIELAFQGFMANSLRDGMGEANKWNNRIINECNIVHWHSSRGVRNRVSLMRGVCDLLGLHSAY